MNVLILCTISPNNVLQLKEALSKHNVVIDSRSSNTFYDNMFKANIIIAHSLNSSEIDNAPELKFVHIWGSGKDQIDIEKLNKRNITYSSSYCAMNESISEYVVMSILLWERNLLYLNCIAKQGKWGWEDRDKILYRELSDINVALIGLGNISSHLHLYLNRLNIRNSVISIKGFETKKYNTTPFTYLDEWDNLNTFDYISCHLPLCNITKEILNDSFFSKMASHAVFINTSRGGIVQESALIDSIVNNKIRGASLDVTTIEPLPNHNPFSHLDRVIITPHIAGRSYKSIDNHLQIIIDNIKRWEGNEEN